MDEEEYLLRELIFEYYGILEANPDWDCTLRDFLVSRGFDSEWLDDYLIEDD